MNFLFLKIKNRLKFIFFFMFNYLSTDISMKKLQKVLDITEVEKKLLFLDRLYFNNKSNPLVVFWFCFYNQSYKNYIKAFKLIKSYDSLLKKWLIKKNLSFTNSLTFLNSAHITGAFGNHWTMFYYLMNKILILKDNNKPTILLMDKDKLTNTTLYNFFSPYINVVRSTNIKYKFKSIEDINKPPIEFTVPFKKKYYPFFSGINFIKQNTKKNKQFNYLSLSSHQIDFGFKILKKLGHPINKRFVTIHIREKKDSCDIFNSNPITYIKSIKDLVSSGIGVIRVGDSSITRLPRIDGLIDYPFTKYKSEFMDIFLASKNFFCIGTSSGYWTVSHMFNKPILLVNYLPVLDYYCLEYDSMFLPKKLYNKKKNNLLKFSEQFSIKNGYCLSKLHFFDRGILIKDNSEDEISNAVKYMSFQLNIQKNDKKKDFLKHNKKYKEYLNKLNEKMFDYPLIAKANFSLDYLRQFELK